MDKKSAYSGRVAAELERLGFDRGFSETVASFLNTEFTSRRMMSYLNNSISVSREDIVDEMLIILQERDRCRQKHIDRARRRKPVEDLFVRSFSINWDYVIQHPEYKKNGELSYLLEIPSLRAVKSLTFHRNLTFFCGENGSGKSTLLEALAIAQGLNPEGGTRNYRFSTYDDWSNLTQALRITHGPIRPEWSYFLRAESFYNVATAALKEYNHDGAMPDYHARSHGESFMDFILDNRREGLYLMDEPEAALSPQKQLELLVYLVQMCCAGSQFIIATHSPILLGAPDAEIWCFDGTIHPIEYEQTDSYRIMSLFVNNRERMLHELFREDR